jgi:hypothetical protein
MVAIRRIKLAAVATLLVASACTSVGTAPSIPAIVIPTIPPINLPGFTIPPINLPGFTIPPIGVPGGVTSTTPCQLVTAAEVGQIFGGQVVDQSTSSTDCTFQASLTSAISVQMTNDTDFTGVQFLLGNTAQQSTIGGYPALSGVFIGQPAIYVQKGANQLQVLGILTGSDPTTIAKLQQVATIAVGRMP